MKKYPFVSQDGIKDCGVSCLEMIIEYYGGRCFIESLRELTKTNKNGTTFYHLKDAACKLGFYADGVKCEKEDFVLDNIILPTIASVTIENKYKHFIVIYEINFKKKYLLIADPGDKIKKITFDKFFSIFNNALLILYPVKSIPMEKKISQLDFVFNILKDHKKLLKNIFVLSFFITIFSIITSFYTQSMINAINTSSKSYLIFIFLIFFSTYLLKILSDFFRNKILVIINQKIDLNLTLDTFNHIIDLPYRYYKSRTTGDIISRINDLDTVRDTISHVALSIFVDLPLTLISLVVLYFINNSLFIIGLIMLVLYIIVIFVFKPLFEKMIDDIQMKKSESTSYMVESISSFETIKGLHIEKNIKNKFENKYVNLLESIYKFQNMYFFQSTIKDLINNIGFVLILLFGSMFVLENKMSIGSMLTFNSLLLYFLEPIKNIINLDSNIKEAKNAIRRVLEISIQNKENGFVDFEAKGNIRISNLTFSFNDRDIVLNKLSLNIEENSKVIVLGESGSGKSTLFKILLKYYKVDNNKVYLNDIDINNYTQKAINKSIVYFGQNELLYNDTIYNNIVFDSALEKDILKVNKICMLDSFIDSKLGFNALIEENGFNFSGGEKQRIMLARTLLRKFNILIIDEGLNQVDIKMERKILKNLIKEYKDKTIIFISHRLDNKDLFDNIINFNKGVKYECI